MPHAVAAALGDLTTINALSETDVHALRRAVYSDGRVDAGEARQLLHLHREGAGRTANGAWADFFVEAIADYYALDRENPGWGQEIKPDYAQAARNVVGALAGAMGRAPDASSRRFDWDEWDSALSQDDAEALVTAFRAEAGDVLDPLERRVLARLCDRVVEMPASLKRFALDAVYATAVADGRVDDEEVRLLRQVLWGPAGDDGLSVSRAEAELLFAVKRAARDGQNAPGWRDVFVKGVANYLGFGGVSPDHVDAAEAAWLVIKLGPPAQIDDLDRALIGFVAHEFGITDPRLTPYADAL